MTQIVLGDSQWYSEGSYLAYASPWGAAPDTAHWDAITFTKGSLPNNVGISWSWPTTLKPSSYGYLQVAYGNYDGGAVMTPIAPRKAGAIKALNAAIGIDAAADPACYNILTEFYLTHSAGNAADKAIEVGFYLSTPPTTKAFVDGGKQLGTFIDQYKRTWQVAQNGTFVTFAPPAGANYTWGSVDYKGGIDFLIAKGVVDPAWWLNGLAIGIEPLGRIGTVALRQWKVTLA